MYRMLKVEKLKFVWERVSKTGGGEMWAAHIKPILHNIAALHPEGWFSATSLISLVKV